MGLFGKHNPFHAFIQEVKKDTKIIKHGVEEAAKETVKVAKVAEKEVVKVASTKIDPDDLAKAGQIITKIGDVAIVVGTLTGQPEIIALGAGLDLTGRGISTVAGIEKGIDNFKEGKPVQGLGEIVGGVAQLGDLAGVDTSKGKDASKFLDKVSKKLDPIIAKQLGIEEKETEIEQREDEILKTDKSILKEEDEIRGDLVSLSAQQLQSTTELKGVERQQQELMEQQQTFQHNEQHFEAKVLQTVERDENEMLNVIDDLAERLEESYTKEFDFRSMVDLMKRLETDDILPFLSRNINDFKKMSKEEQQMIIQLGLSKGV